MTHDELVERVARAISVAQGYADENTIDAARAAIRAVAEATQKPTRAMAEAVRSNGGGQGVAWGMATWPDMHAASVMWERPR